jgi:hypothetical protein
MNKREKQQMDSEKIIVWTFVTIITLGAIYFIINTIIQLLN